MLPTTTRAAPQLDVSSDKYVTGAVAAMRGSQTGQAPPSEGTWNAGQNRTAPMRLGEDRCVAARPDLYASATERGGHRPRPVRRLSEALPVYAVPDHDVYGLDM
jgi:hypothetical protein